MIEPRRTVASFHRALFALLIAWLLCPLPAFALNVQRLEPADIDRLNEILKTLEPVITAKKQGGTANLLTWEGLYTPLIPAQRAFLDEFRALKGQALGATSRYFGEVAASDLVPVGPESVRKDGVLTRLDRQYLPSPVFEAYVQMMEAMNTDIGKRLYIESGYRSPAYQLYLFLYYLPKHDYSVTETNRFVALPGHSEHGYPLRQAIDFMNEDGISGEDHPEAFETLPEYRWLQQHARAFKFALSYPRDNTERTAFEPWHWHYENGDQPSATSSPR